MPNQWKLNLSQYGISDEATQELRYFCLRYPAMRRRLAELRDPLRGVAYDGMPHGSGSGEPTAAAAEKAAELSQQCEMIEQSAIEADAGLYQWILEAVTKGLTYSQVRARGAPCGERLFDKKRKLFFACLARRKHVF